MFVSIGKQSSFPPYTEKVYRDPGREAGRQHFARNVLLNDGLSESMTNRLLVHGSMSYPRRSDLVSSFPIGPWDFGPKMIDKETYHESGMLSVAKDSQVCLSSFIKRLFVCSPLPPAFFECIEDTYDRWRPLVLLYSIRSQDLSIKRDILGPLIGSLPPEPKSDHKQRQPSNHEARVIHRRRRNRQRERKAEDNDKCDDV